MPIRVLIVDDDPVLGELLVAVLHSAGMSADAVTDSKKAQVQLLREKFDAVFLDVHMPRPTGLELLRQMRAAGPNQKTPAVMITGDNDPSVLKSAFEAGVDFFLFKPVDRGRVLRVLRASHALVQREKRRFQRVEVPCAVTIEAQQRKVEGLTRDVSLNGLLAQTGDVFPVGSLVNVSLKLATSSPPVLAKGRVVRLVAPNSMGIQLENLGASEAARLQEFLLPLILAQVGKDSDLPRF